MGCSLSSSADGLELTFADIDVLFSATHGIEIKSKKINELMNNIKQYSANSQQTILKANQSINRSLSPRQQTS